MPGELLPLVLVAESTHSDAFNDTLQRFVDLKKDGADESIVMEADCDEIYDALKMVINFQILDNIRRPVRERFGVVIYDFFPVNLESKEIRRARIRSMRNGDKAKKMKHPLGKVAHLQTMIAQHN